MPATATAAARSAPQEALGEFILSFVQALLRTGYYKPDHPQARKSKQGLHGCFQRLFQGRHELTFMVQDLGESKNVLVEGVLAESQRLNSLMPAGMAEVYVPRLAHFLERKQLVSLTLKESMGEDEFSRFVDVMSEPGTAALDAEGRQRFVAQLRERGVESFSLLFLEDLVVTERKLPWRAHLAIARLQKDLQHIPLYHGLDEHGLRKVRQQVLHEVLRPIARADLLCALLLNTDLVATHEVGEQEIERELADFIFEKLVVPTGRAALDALSTPGAPAPPARQKRALAALLLRERAKEPEGLPELVREVFDRGLLEFEQLPPALQDQVLLERATDQFLQQRTAVLGRLERTAEPEPYRQQAGALLQLIPELLRRGLLEEVLGLATTLRGHAALGEARAGVAAGMLEHLTAGAVATTLREKFLRGKKEDRVAIATLYQALGEAMVPQLVAIVGEAQDVWVRKNAVEVLLRMGPSAAAALFDEIEAGRLGAAALPEVAMVLGEMRCGMPAAIALLHELARGREPKLREEAAWALCRTHGAAEEGLFVRLLGDDDLEVRRRALRCLRTARCGGALPKLVELISLAEREPALAPLEASLYQALPELAEAAGARARAVEPFLLDLLQRSQPQGLLKAFQRPKHPLSEDAFAAVCTALGAAGSPSAQAALLELSKRLRDPARQHVQQAIERIEARRGS